MMRTLSLVALFLVGCSTLPDKDQTCGNGVIDRGESCDNSRPECQQCQLTCSADVDCTDPATGAGAGYRCGADLICHAPSGVFDHAKGPRLSFSFPVGQGTIADLDGDHIGDVVGFSDINIDVRYGDLQTSFATRTTALVPFANENLAIRTILDATGHGTSDMLLPTKDGIASFVSRGKTLGSYPFALAPGASGDCATVNGTAAPGASFSIDKRHLAFVARDHATGTGKLSVLDPTGAGGPTCKRIDLCGMPLPVDPEKVPIVYDHYETSNGDSILAIAAPPDETSLTSNVCLVRYSFDAINGYSLSPMMSLVTRAGPVTLARSVAGSACPALYVPDVTGHISYYPAGGIVTPCSIATTPQVISKFGPMEMPAGRLPLVPNIGGRGADALAVVSVVGLGGTTAFYALDANAPNDLMYQSPRPLYPIRAADIDGDGSVEAIGMVSIGLTGQPDFDILYRTSIGTLISYRMATQSVPHHVELGDFDGNSITDIAYTERLGGKERLVVAYGTPDRPTEPIEMAAFANVVTLSRIDLPDSIEPLGQVLDDLVVIDLPGPADAEMSILHGNPQRSMLAYYDPRSTIGIVGDGFSAAVAGNFVGANFVDGTDVPVQDLIAFETTKTGVTLWEAPGVTTPGSRGLGPPVNPAGIPTTITDKDCTSATPDTVPMCINDSRFVPWKVGDHDILLGVDAGYEIDPTKALSAQRQRRLVKIDPASSTPVLPSSVTIDPEQGVVDLWTGDIDGDQHDNFVIAAIGIGGFGKPENDKVLDCVTDDSGTPTGCKSLADEVPDLSGYLCRGAKLGRVLPFGRQDTPPPRDGAGVLALCRDGGVQSVFRIVADEQQVMHAEPIIPNAGPGFFMAVGDINGDTVDDLLVVSFSPATGLPNVDVYPQCTASDTACIDANNAVRAMEGP